MFKKGGDRHSPFFSEAAAWDGGTVGSPRVDRIVDPYLGPSGAEQMSPASLIPLQAAIDRHGLGAQREGILATVRPAIRLTPSLSALDALPLGASRFGGRPDLPPGEPWPRREGRPLHFLASLRLSDLALFDVEERLPSGGQLCFWYDAVEQPWGSAKDALGFVVRHVEDGALERTTRPPAAATRLAPPEFASARLTFHLEPSLVPIDVTGGPEIPDDLLNSYEALTDELVPYWTFKTPSHFVLGWPRVVQSDVRSDCRNVVRGHIADGESAEDYWRSCAEWRLLLQLDSDHDLRWRWGDAGRLYFMIRDADLAAERFEASWLQLQCT